MFTLSAWSCIVFTFKSGKNEKIGRLAGAQKLELRTASDRLVIKFPICSDDANINHRQTSQVPHHLMCYLAKGKRITNGASHADLTTPYRNRWTSECRQ